MGTRAHRLSVAVIVAALVVGSVAPALAQTEEPIDPASASYWTGTWTPTGQDPADEEERPGYTEVRVVSYGTVDASDPRIAGEWTHDHRIRRFFVEGEVVKPVQVAVASVRIDTEDGAWVGSFTGFYGEPGGEEWNVLAGEGAYEGLTAVFRWHMDDSLEGVIVPGGLPSLPDPVPPPSQ